MGIKEIEEVMLYASARLVDACNKERLHQLSKMIERSEIDYNSRGYVRFDEIKLDEIVHNELDNIEKHISTLIMKEELNLEESEYYDAQDICDDISASWSDSL